LLQNYKESEQWKLLLAGSCCLMPAMPNVASSGPGIRPGIDSEDDMPMLRIVISSAILALSIAARSGAETLPPSVRACIGLSDAGQRLACYDREVARLIAPVDTFTQAPAAVAPVAPLPSSTVPAASPPPVAEVRHLTAKVSAVHQSGDNLIVTLDNGSVWEQTTSATSQLSLRLGDVVKVDREMGGWFLSDRYGDNIQVRMRQP
jgi:hypothetical protein